ncbi:MAG: ribosome maturation factor RimP [Candidatus Latescibacterota bacterium]|jgi:ribosome maturation factor RimP|nr:MAG: ribosome maturation factor RimP [Candidatus Latescibacterota bacterium]
MTLDRGIEELVAREVEALGYELVKVEFSVGGRRGTLRVFIDRTDAGISIDDCVRVTKSLGLALDGGEAMPGPYTLEVSSPGSHRPLVKRAHFERFLGERARVSHLDETGKRETATGAIATAGETAVTIRAEDGTRTIPYERILRANLQPDDGPPPEPGRARRGRRAGRRPRRRG